MPYKSPGNRAIGYLSASYVAASGSLVLGAGQGGRFATLAAGEYYHVLLVDESYSDFDTNWQILKVTARSGDTLTGTAAQEGTTDRDFPVGGVGQPQQCRVSGILSERMLRMIASGAGAKIQATVPALDADSPEPIILTPTANMNLPMPETNVWTGKRFVIFNLATAYTITLQSSSGATILVLPAASSVRLIALQDEPTAASDWGMPATFFPAGFRFGTGGTATHKGAGIPRGSSGVLLTQYATVTLAAGVGSGVLNSFTFPANSLSVDGSFLICHAAGTKTGTTGAFSLEFRVGTTAVGTACNFTLTGVMDWYMFLLLIRTSAGNQKFAFYARPPSDATGSVTLMDYGTLAKDETTNLEIDVFCTTKNSVASDVVTGELLAPILFG